MTALGSGLSALDSKVLIELLKTKRWFGKKSRAVLAAELTDVIPVKWPGNDKSFAVARAKVTTDEGVALYQLFLSEDSETTDALENPQFRRALADAFINGVTFEHHGARWIVQSESKEPLVVPPKVPVTLSSAEQTNSSVVIDGEAILKLYRRLEPGIHPDVEVTRFLTIERQFVHVPVLLGTIRFEDTGGGLTGVAGVTIAGMLQELVPGAVDGWTYALERARMYFKGSHWPPPARLPFEEEAGQLGTVTRAMHEALASGEPGSDFDLRPATSDDIRRWARGATETIEKTTTSLAQAVAEKRLARKHVAEASAIVERRNDYVAAIARIVDAIGSDAGANARTHGDYHLGQVLRSSASQFLVIDFEGEPTRPLQERRARHSPLRDVAGMLRSFAYASAMSFGLYAVGEKRTAHSAQRTAQQWERSARDAFLLGYFSHKNGRGALLPRADSNARRILQLFELEKAFYELQYELDHRLEWIWIPLRAVTQLGQ